MNYLSPDMLYDHNYSIKVVNALRRFWADGHDSFSSIGEPKAMHMILYLDSCAAEYTLKDGRKLYAGSGNIVYAPKNSEYSVRFPPSTAEALWASTYFSIKTERIFLFRTMF